MEIVAWGRNVVKAMFPRASHGNIDKHFGEIEQALDRSLKTRKITDSRDILKLKLYACATVRAENATFEPRDEKQGRSNTIYHAPKPPKSLGNLSDLHAVSERLIEQHQLDNPYGRYDYRRDLGNDAHGMGHQYRGRGFVQLTGKANYIKYGSLAEHPRIVEFPNEAGKPAVAARLLAAYVLENSDRILKALNEGDLGDARKVVNGGKEGLEAFCDAYETGRRLVEPRDRKDISAVC